MDRCDDCASGPDPDYDFFLARTEPEYVPVVHYVNPLAPINRFLPSAGKSEGIASTLHHAGDAFSPPAVNKTQLALGVKPVPGGWHGLSHTLHHLSIVFDVFANMQATGHFLEHPSVETAGHAVEVGVDTLWLYKAPGASLVWKLHGLLHPYSPMHNPEMRSLYNCYKGGECTSAQEHELMLLGLIN